MQSSSTGRNSEMGPEGNCPHRKTAGSALQPGTPHLRAQRTWGASLVWKGGPRPPRKRTRRSRGLWHCSELCCTPATHSNTPGYIKEAVCVASPKVFSMNLLQGSSEWGWGWGASTMTLLERTAWSLGLETAFGLAICAVFEELFVDGEFLWGFVWIFLFCFVFGIFDSCDSCSLKAPQKRWYPSKQEQFSEALKKSMNLFCVLGLPLLVQPAVDEPSPGSLLHREVWSFLPET